MLLTTNTVTESNRDILRLLMAGFYLSSERSKTLYAILEAHSVKITEKKKQYLEGAWAQALEAGPLERNALEAVLKEDPELSRHYNMVAQDNKARFFSHLNEFVQHLKILPHNPSLKGSTKHPLFAALPTSDEFQRLKEEIRVHFPELMKELRLKNVQDLILSDFTPAKVSFNVVPIRPDIAMMNPMVPVQASDQPPSSPPAVQIA